MDWKRIWEVKQAGMRKERERETERQRRSRGDGGISKMRLMVMTQTEMKNKVRNRWGGKGMKRGPLPLPQAGSHCPDGSRLLPNPASLSAPTHSRVWPQRRDEPLASPAQAGADPVGVEARDLRSPQCDLSRCPFCPLQAASSELFGQACLNPDLWIPRTQLVMLWPVASSRFLDLQ